MTWPIVWMLSGATSFGIDLWAYHQRTSGALGMRVQDRYREYVAMSGGMRHLIWLIAFANFLFPPVALACCLASYRNDLQVHKYDDYR